MKKNLEDEVNRIVNFIRSVVKNANAKGVVIGLSGGIDSSLTAFLCVKSLGKDRVFGVIMPERDSNPLDRKHGEMIGNMLGIKYTVSDITDVLKAFGAGGYVPTKEFDKIADGNLKPRIRMCILYYFANKKNYLVAGTGNKTEIYMGYGTKYGDLGCDFMPIAHLFKKEVRELAKYLGVPEEIIAKKPSAGLWIGQTDEDELGIDYETLDNILVEYEKGKSPDEIVEMLKIDKSKVYEIFERIEKNRHKSEPIPKLS